MLVVHTMAETDEPAGPPITLIDPIDVSKLNKKFREEIQSMPDGEELSACFACSTCTAACPIANIWEYKPHQLIRMIILGLRDEVLSSDEIWLCLTCFQCQERCPQKVREEGKVPPNIVGLGKELLEKGQLYTVTADWEREDMGLEPEVPGLSVDPVKGILAETRTKKLVEDGE